MAAGHDSHDISDTHFAVVALLDSVVLHMLDILIRCWCSLKIAAYFERRLCLQTLPSFQLIPLRESGTLRFTLENRLHVNPGLRIRRGHFKNTNVTSVGQRVQTPGIC